MGPVLIISANQVSCWTDQLISVSLMPCYHLISLIWCMILCITTEWDQLTLRDQLRVILITLGQEKNVSMHVISMYMCTRYIFAKKINQMQGMHLYFTCACACACTCKFVHTHNSIYLCYLKFFAFFFVCQIMWCNLIFMYKILLQLSIFTC